MRLQQAGRSLPRLEIPGSGRVRPQTMYARNGSNPAVQAKRPGYRCFGSTPAVRVGRPGCRSLGWNGDLVTRPLRSRAITGLRRRPVKAAIRSGPDPTAQRSDRVSAAAWRAWVHAASTRSRVVMLMRSGRCDCATLRRAVGRALAVSADWHGGGAGQFIRLAGIREGLAASERHGGDERGGQVAERFHAGEPFMVRAGCVLRVARSSTDVKHSGSPAQGNRLKIPLITTG